MARQLHHIPQTASQAGLALISLLLCCFALYLCASHSRKWRRRHGWGSCYGFSSHEPVIQLTSEPTMLATHTLNYDQSTFSSQLQQDVPVWQRNILMGGKCQLPDFSGVIIYNSDGQIVPPQKPLPMLTWK